MKITVHDKWIQNGLEYDGDIAILTFGEEIPLSTFVQPTCICGDDYLNELYEGYIGGWGQSLVKTKKVPIKVKHSIHRDQQCFANMPENVSPKNVFCVGRDDSKNICPGDGAGFFKKAGSRFYFRGIVSFGIKDQANCDVTKFAVVSDTLQYERWIDVVMMKEETSEPKKLHCTMFDGYLWHYYSNISRKLKSCMIFYQEVDSEGFTIASSRDKEMKALSIENNKKVKFLPENIADLYLELVAYHVQECSIHTVNDKHFKGLTKLEDLSLSNNEIELIARDSFKDLTNLEKLNLAHNKLKFIEPKLFQTLSKPKTVWLIDNEIEALDEHVFDKMVNVKDIYLTNNKLSVIPENLFKNNLKLSSIQLKANQIQVISGSMFDHLNDVTFIDLQKNTCVDVFYRQKVFTGMKELLKTKCSAAI